MVMPDECPAFFMERGMANILRSVINRTLNVIKFFEEKSKSAKIIRGMKRSIQLDNYSCGAHCTYMIVNYYNKKISLGKIIKQLKTDENGTSEKSIFGLFRKNGLTVKENWKASRRDIKKAVDNGFPILISMYKLHWSIIYGYTRMGIFILDPSLGYIFNEWNWKEFLKVWDDRWIAIVTD